ncbi:MAG: signal peptidase I [Solirubrobacteraceae bacterium]
MATAQKSVLSSLVELIVIVATALGLALAIQALIVKPYRIPSGSMLPTLHINQRILVDRIGEDFSAPHLGDIVVFHPPGNYANGCADSAEGQNANGVDALAPCGVAWPKPSSETFVKRLVGLPGDHISIRNGVVIRNGVAEKDPYAIPCDGAPTCNFPGTITIPKGDYYFMGDNRPDSEDSRFWGPVPKAWIIGTAFFTYWPPDRLGFL